MILDWITSVATAAAAAFAGWAALASSAAVRESRRLVEIELERDRERAEAELTSQARRISMNLITEDLLDDSGRVGIDFHLVLINASDSPVFKARLSVVAGDGEWGPQLSGNLIPGQRLELYGRIYTGETLGNTDAFVRFVDVNNRAWIATARGPAEPAPDDLDDWIARGRTFAQRSLDDHERGMWNGQVMPEFDQWRAEIEDR